MQTSRVGAAVAALLLVAGESAAQAPADFSGKWTLVPPARAAGTSTGSTPPTLSDPGDMGSGWGSEITITQDASTLKVVYTYFHPREVQPPFTFTYALNGAPSTNTVNLGRGPQEQVSTAAWRGTSLAITTRHTFVNPQDGKPLRTETTQVLSLESPTTMMIETSRGAILGGRASATKTRYQKQ